MSSDQTKEGTTTNGNAPIQAEEASTNVVGSQDPDDDESPSLAMVLEIQTIEDAGAVAILVGESVPDILPLKGTRTPPIQSRYPRDSEYIEANPMDGPVQSKGEHAGLYSDGSFHSADPSSNLPPTADDDHLVSGRRGRRRSYALPKDDALPPLSPRARVAGEPWHGWPESLHLWCLQTRRKLSRQN